MIFSEPIEAYLARLAARNLPAVFEEMHAEATRRCFPIVGPEVGRLFLQLARLRRPRRVIELGSGFGYSAIWWGLGSGDGVAIHCTDHDQRNIDAGRRFAQAAGVGERLHWHRGDALATARQLDGPWDIIFVDIDKQSYPEAFAWAKGVLRAGDLLLFDNMLWHGNVVQPEGDRDAATQAVVDVTEALYSDPDFDVSLLPVRDGVVVALRR